MNLDSTPEKPADPLAAEAAAAVRRREITATHEAGHAVMALLLGRNVQRVSVEPNRSRLGACELKKDSSRASKDPLEADALILLAGMIAESRMTGHFNTSAARSDLNAVQKLAEYRGGGEKQVDRLFRRWMDKADHCLDQPHARFAIQAIAAQLMIHSKISGRSALHHFNEAGIQAKKS